MLSEVRRFILNNGELRPRRKQGSEEGRKWFRMHPEIGAFLESRL